MKTWALKKRISIITFVAVGVITIVSAILLTLAIVWMTDVNAIHTGEFDPRLK